MNYKPSYLGLDLGEKTLGIAFSSTGIIANKFTTLYFPNHQYHYLLKPLKSLILEKNINTVVLGYPKHMNNDVGVKGLISINFRKRLLEYLKLDVQIVLWDERLTTKQALQFLQNFQKKRIKNLKDEVAATLILQNFLDFQENMS